MIATTQDILNLVLAIGVGLVSVFLCMVLYQLIFILHDLGETTKAVKHAARQVDDLIVQPTKILSFLFEQLRHIFGSLDLVGLLDKRRKK